MATPPSGPDADHPTRILGTGWDAGCSNPPELFGVEKEKQVIGLFNVSNIDMQCLEITDHENCSTNHSLDPSIQCNTSFPYGDYAQRGIEMRDVKNLHMKNINIHGITGPGIRGAEVTNWTVEDSRVSYNNAGGINGQTPGKTPNQFYGTMRFVNTDISWNGCVEDYPSKNIIVKGSCVGGNSGGYGDGVGLQETAGTWYWDHDTFIGNVEDGLDMLYMRTMTGIAYVSNSYFEHNAGNALKTGANAVVTNNVLIGDCNYFTGKSIVGDVVACRGNATLSVTLQKNNSSITVLNNSLTGQADSLISISSSSRGKIQCDGTERAYMADNIFRGGIHFQLPNTKLVDAYYIYNTCSGFKYVAKNNLFYNTKDKSNDCNTSTDSICGKDPLFTLFDEADGKYDFKLQVGSPAIGYGLSVGTLAGFNAAVSEVPATDFYGDYRRLSAVDIGMDEYTVTKDKSPSIKVIQIIK